MTYKIITDDTGEEVCRSAIRSALDPTMKNLREDLIEIEKDPVSLEHILSPAEAISTKIKSDATDPTAPSAELQQHFLKTRDTHIAEQPGSFVYLRDNGENENLIWKEFEVTL
jgi:hypothetical protein